MFTCSLTPNFLLTKQEKIYAIHLRCERKVHICIQTSERTMENDVTTQNDAHNCIANSLKTYQQALMKLRFTEAQPPPPPKQAKCGFKKYLCSQCEKKFTSSACVNQHLKAVHKVSVPVITNIKCLDCIDSKCFATVKHLRLHLMKDHGYRMDEEKHVFPSMNEFFSWKRNMEAETNSLYSKQSGTKCIKYCKIHFFMCHRSGLYSSSGTGKRSIKSQGSCKLGFFCTSTVTAMETKNRVIVNYVKQHYMHSNDVSYLRLSQEEKFEIASKLLDGVPCGNILKEFCNKEGNFKKSSMLTRKNIYNIKYNIESIIDSELNNTQSKNLCAGGNCPVVVNLSSQDNIDYTSESLPIVQLSDCASDGNLQRPVQTNAELCIDKALEKLKVLCDTLSENKKEFGEEVSREILKRVDHLVEISRLKTLSSETPVTQLRTVELVTVQQPQMLFFVKPPTYQKAHFVITNSPISKSNGASVKKLLPLRPKTTINQPTNLGPQKF